MRIDPFWRLNMNRTGSTFSAKFRTPDQNGVFKFKIDYVRAGYSRIFIEEVAPNRIWRHDEHERVFLAYGQYTSVWVTFIGTLIFSAFFLFTK